MKETESEDLQLWFGLSRASWLTIPRVLMEGMPVEWQEKMAALLNEFNDTFEPPNYNTHVSVSRHGRYIEMPEWITNYGYPDPTIIEAMRSSASIEKRD